MPTKPSATPTPTPAPRKRAFSKQELGIIHDALQASPAVRAKKGLIERVVDVLNDPGVTVPPDNTKTP